MDKIILTIFFLIGVYANLRHQETIEGLEKTIKKYELQINSQKQAKLREGI